MYVERVRIDGIRGFYGDRASDVQFGDQTRSNPLERYPGLTVVAGRNGSGKSTFLRAIAAGLSGPDVVAQLTQADRGWVSQGQQFGEIEIGLIPPDDGVDTGAGQTDKVAAHLRWQPTRHDRSRPTGNLSVGGRRQHPAQPGEWPSTQSGWFGAGYGPYRRLAGTAAEVVRLTVDDHAVHRFATLFREEASLAETVQWLQQVNYRARSGQAGYGDLDARMLALLNHGLLPDGLQAERVDPDGLWLRDSNSTVLRIDEMSDGYRGVTALVTDIVRQIHECFDGRIAWYAGSVPQIMTAGVVLIDEIDAHLHVTWQKDIGDWLCTHFPQIQFIVTTHSPYVCQSARPGGLIRLSGPNGAGGARVVDEELYRRVVHGSGDDGVLTELFGLDSPYSDQTENLRRRLTVLETAALRDQADDDQLAELAELTETIVPSPSSRVRDTGPNQ